ncbi:MAG TPA: hypothetical protein VMD30_08540 [Tepidisphaeraceae bacterium]|nr:hypothetical protein [Tepidisphaeraceae bacterium]
MKRLFAIICCLVAAPALALGPATRPVAPPVADPSVAALIGELGDADFRARDSAENHLVDLGRSVEPSLRQAADNSQDLEIRNRAAAAIARIEQDIANAPTYITLHARAEEARQVMAEMSRQANITVSVMPQQMWNGPADPRINLDLDHVPFWKALGEFCKQAGVWPQPMGFPDNGTLTLFPAANSPLGGICDDRGRFTIFASQLVRNRIVTLNNGAVQRDDHLQLMVCVDPKFRLLSHGMPHLDVAIDDKGNSWAGGVGLSPMFRGVYMPMESSWSFGALIPLQSPPRPATKLSEIRGTIPALLATQIQTLEVNDLAKQVGQTHNMGDRSVKIESWDATAGRCEVSLDAGGSPRVLIRQPIGRGMMILIPQQQRLFDEVRTMQLLDANGQAVASFQGTRFDGTHFVAMFGFPPADPPVTLKWEYVVAKSTVQIPFEFKDIPLPAN